MPSGAFRDDFPPATVLGMSALVGRQLRRRVVLQAAAAAGLAPLASGCQAAGAALSNPAVQSWLVGLASTLGATIITDLAKQGADKTIKDWSTGFWEAYHRLMPDRTQPGQECAYATGYRSEGTPAFLLIALVAAATSSRSECQASKSDPLNDPCAVIINKGKDSFLLPAWAWQTLVTFAQDQTSSKRDADLQQMKALLSVALGPTSSKVESNRSWANAVAYVSYMTHLGPVDLAKVEKPDHSFTGLIKVSGFPDKQGFATVWEYKLPTSAG